MKLKFWMLAMMLALATLAHGATNDLTGLLQKGLFEEEANRDLNAAIANYQSLANAFDKDRQLAATAIFRLGECYRKLGKTNDAVTQYQRIIKEFNDQQTLVTLSRQNLTGLNVAPASAASGANGSSLQDAEANAAMLQSQIEGIKKMPHDQQRIFVEQNFSNPELAQLASELDLAQQSLIALKIDYTQDHPKYKSAQALVEDLNQKIDAQVQGVVSSLEGKLSIAQIQINLLRNHESVEASGAGGSAVLLRLQIERARQQIAGDQTEEKELLKNYLPTNARIVDLRKRIESENADLAALTEKLQALPGAAPEGANPVTTDEEQQQIRNIQVMIQNSPDLINSSDSEGKTPLIRAAEKGQLVVAKYLLDHGADVNRRGRNAVPLSAAAENGQKAMVELLLSRGADVNGGGLNPLYEAVQKGYVAVAEVLLANKADVNLPSGSTHSIHRAVQSGRSELVQLLISHGADVNVADGDGRTPLEFAALQNDTNAAKLLLKAKADIESRDKNGSTPLNAAAEKGKTAMVSLLLDSGALVDSTNADETTPLWVAVLNRNTDAARMLLEHKADPNRLGMAPSHSWATRMPPVITAILTGNNEALKLLLDAGANVEGESGAFVPLQIAIGHKNVGSVQLLLEHGADPNREVNGVRPLNSALLHRWDKQFARLLLDKGADANAQDSQGAPLFCTDDPEIGRWLVEHKADVNARWVNNLTPLINSTGATNYLKFLLEAGAQVDSQETNGNTALHEAVYYSMTESVALLLAHKADPNIQNNQGFTPRDLAEAGKRGQNLGQMMGFGNINSPPPKEAQVEIADLLAKAGGLVNLPKRNRIEVRRASESGVAFTKGSQDWNRYSLLEMIAGSYRLISQDTVGEWRGVNGVRSGLWTHEFRFPDFKKVVIYRRTGASAKQTAINVDVEDILNKNDCSRDVWLEWGDVVEIPEADHPVDERWGGLAPQVVVALTNCLARQVTIIVKGESTQMKFAPEVLSMSKTLINGGIGGIEDNLHLTTVSFMLRSVLDNSKLVRVSSDLSHVKVTRIDPETKKKMEWVIDCTNPNQADLWLRDGDVIEVPEK